MALSDVDVFLNKVTEANNQLNDLIKKFKSEYPDLIFHIMPVDKNTKSAYHLRFSGFAENEFLIATIKRKASIDSASGHSPDLDPPGSQSS